MELNKLTPNSGKSKKRIGRGIGSGKGKTSGRGHKGQKSRSGVAIKSFEGGQMPLYRRLPKRGFKSFGFDKSIAVINLSKIQNILEKSKDFSSNKINLLSLQKLNVINKKYKKLKLLGDGEIKQKLNIEVNLVSKSAKEKVEKSGGIITILK